MKHTKKFLCAVLIAASTLPCSALAAGAEEQSKTPTDSLLICRQDRPNGSYRILEAEAFLFDSEIGQEETAYEPMNSGWEDTTAKNGSSYRYRLYFVKGNHQKTYSSWSEKTSIRA